MRVESAILFLLSNGGWKQKYYTAAAIMGLSQEERRNLLNRTITQGPIRAYNDLLTLNRPPPPVTAVVSRLLPFDVAGD